MEPQRSAATLCFLYREQRFRLAVDKLSSGHLRGCSRFSMTFTHLRRSISEIWYSKCLTSSRLIGARCPAGFTRPVLSFRVNTSSNASFGCFHPMPFKPHESGYNRNAGPANHRHGFRALFAVPTGWQALRLRLHSDGRHAANWERNYQGTCWSVVIESTVFSPQYFEFEN